MKKHVQCLLLLAALLMPWVGRAQMPFSDYDFTVSNVTYSSISSTGTSMSLSSQDDGHGTCTLPFAFNFGESTLASGSTIACSANGFIYLGASSTSGTLASYTDANKIINSLVNQDAHMGRNTGAGVYYKHDAAAGTFTIEYVKLGLYSATSSTYGSVTYQVVLHNTGAIDLI